MGFLKDLLAGGASKLVDSVGDVLDEVITSKEEKLQLANEMAKAEMQFQLDVQKMNNEERAMVLGDISNARSREVQIQATVNATWLNKNLMPFLALGTIWLVMSMFFVLIFFPDLIKAENKEILMYILGVVSTVLVQIYSYYFGSSAGSVAKQKTIEGFKT
jgi:hypothetical protein